MKYTVKKKKWDKKVKWRLKYKEAKRKEAEKYLLKLLVISVVIIILFFTGPKIYNFILNTPYFQIKDIRIEGLQTLSQSQVLDFSGLHLGENIFKINLKKTKSKIESCPIVKYVKISRNWPNSILINVKERMPIGLIKRDDQLYGLDEERVIFKLISEDPVIRLPLITGINNDLVIGKIKDNFRLNTAVNLLEEFLNVALPISDQILIIDLSDIEYIILETKNCGKIRLGNIDFNVLRKKLKQLCCVLEDIKEKTMTVEYIDLRFKNIVVKPMVDKLIGLLSYQPINVISS